jgi:hypothetical protein
MSIKSASRFLNAGANMVLVAKLTPEISRLVKKRSKEQMAEALSSDEGMATFARDLYQELSAQIRNQVPLEGFIDFVQKNRTRIMGKKRNQKTVEAMAS